MVRILIRISIRLLKIIVLSDDGIGNNDDGQDNDFPLT